MNKNENNAQENMEKGTTGKTDHETKTNNETQGKRKNIEHLRKENETNTKTKRKKTLKME